VVKASGELGAGLEQCAIINDANNQCRTMLYNNIHCVPKKTCDHVFDDKLK